MDDKFQFTVLWRCLYEEYIGFFEDIQDQTQVTERRLTMQLLNTTSKIHIFLKVKGYSSFPFGRPVLGFRCFL